MPGNRPCFFNYPLVPCPSNDDPALTRLTFAFFGLPALWLVGLAFALLKYSRRRRSA